jgi:hypothetical protein
MPSSHLVGRAQSLYVSSTCACCIISHIKCWDAEYQKSLLNIYSTIRNMSVSIKQSSVIMLKVHHNDKVFLVHTMSVGKRLKIGIQFHSF